METEKMLQKYFTPAMLELLAAFREQNKPSEDHTAELYAGLERWLAMNRVNNVEALNVLITAVCRRLEMWEGIIKRKK